VGLTNLGSKSETCVGSRVRLVGVFISFEKNFYRLPFTPPLSGSPYRSFTTGDIERALRRGKAEEVWLRREWREAADHSIQRTRRK
jgi:hypothetical protein